MQEVPVTISYSVKIINAENKGGYIVEDWKDKKFSTVKEIEERMIFKFAKYLSSMDHQFGYLSRGHGFKGKQNALSTDDDLMSMYTEYSGMKSITMWLKLKPTRKRHSTSGASDADIPQAKRANRTEEIKSNYPEVEGQA